MASILQFDHGAGGDSSETAAVYLAPSAHPRVNTMRKPILLVPIAAMVALLYSLSLNRVSPTALDARDAIEVAQSNDGAELNDAPSEGEIVENGRTALGGNERPSLQRQPSQPENDHPLPIGTSDPKRLENIAVRQATLESFLAIDVGTTDGQERFEKFARQAVLMSIFIEQDAADTSIPQTDKIAIGALQEDASMRGPGSPLELIYSGGQVYPIERDREHEYDAIMRSERTHGIPVPFENLDVNSIRMKAQYALRFTTE